MADYLKKKKNRMLWYDGELLDKAKELGERLLPAFNTTTGMPYPRVGVAFLVKCTDLNKITLPLKGSLHENVRYMQKCVWIL